MADTPKANARKFSEDETTALSEIASAAYRGANVAELKKSLMKNNIFLRDFKNVNERMGEAGVEVEFKIGGKTVSGVLRLKPSWQYVFEAYTDNPV